MTAGNAWYFALLAEPAWWTGGATVLAASALALAARGRQLARAPFLAAAAMAVGFAAAQLATARAPPPMDVPRRGITVTGLVRAVEALPEGMRVTLEAPAFDAGTPQPRVVRVRLRDEDPVMPVTGDRLAVRALLRAPSPPAYPGAWDLQRDAWFSGIGAYGYALRRADILASGTPSGIARTIQGLRETIAARVAAVLDGAVGAICATLLTGTTAAIPQDDRAAFRDSGLAHLLAIAGLHIGIVMGLIFGADANAAGRVGAGDAALADQADRGAGGAGGRRRLHAADRRACADHPQLQHGLPGDARRAAGPSRAVVARAGAGHGGIAADRARTGHGRQLPDELFRRAGADRRLRRAATGAVAAARARVLAAPAGRACGGAGADQRAGRHRVGPVRGVSFRPRAAVQRAGQRGGGAADGAVDHAGGADRAGADAAAPGGSCARPDGLGRRRGAVDRPCGLGPAVRHGRRAAHAALGAGGASHSAWRGSGCGGRACGWPACRWSCSVLPRRRSSARRTSCLPPMAGWPGCASAAPCSCSRAGSSPASRRTRGSRCGPPPRRARCPTRPEPGIACTETRLHVPPASGRPRRAAAARPCHAQGLHRRCAAVAGADPAALRRPGAMDSGPLQRMARRRPGRLA